jgi:hypothetical protein
MFFDLNGEAWMPAHHLQSAHISSASSKEMCRGEQRCKISQIW